jgi:hypothetical protein
MTARPRHWMVQSIERTPHMMTRDYSTVETVRQHLSAGRQARQARRTLEKDLAAFATPGERTELYALLARYPDAETEDLRRALDRVPVA